MRAPRTAGRNAVERIDTRTHNLGVPAAQRLIAPELDPVTVTSFLNGWGAAPAVVYALDNLGFLHVHGAVTHGAPGLGEQAVFRLAEGFRPVGTVIQGVQVGLGHPISNRAQFRVDGLVVVNVLGAPAATNTVFFSNRLRLD